MTVVSHLHKAEGPVSYDCHSKYKALTDLSLTTDTVSKQAWPYGMIVKGLGWTKVRILFALSLLSKAVGEEFDPFLPLLHPTPTLSPLQQRGGGGELK